MIIELPNSAIEVVCKLFDGIISFGYYPRKRLKSIIILILIDTEARNILPSFYRPLRLLS